MHWLSQTKEASRFPQCAKWQYLNMCLDSALSKILSPNCFFFQFWWAHAIIEAQIWAAKWCFTNWTVKSGATPLGGRPLDTRKTWQLHSKWAIKTKRAGYKNNSQMLRPLTELTEYPAWSNIYLSHIFHESSIVLALGNGETFHLALPTVRENRRQNQNIFVRYLFVFVLIAACL